MKKYISHKYDVECNGADNSLDKIVEVDVEITKRPGGNIITSYVECPYITGGHEEKCSLKKGMFCKYVNTFPSGQRG